MHTIRTLVVLLTLTVISACGFHLRGSLAVDLPEGVEPIYIGGHNSGPLYSQLHSLLNTYNVELTTEASQANHQLIILKHHTDRRTASIGRGARAAEIQLIEQVSFQLQNKQGQIIAGPNTLTQRRILKNDPNKVASTSNEESLLRKEMLMNLAAKIARRVSSINYQLPPAATTAQPDSDARATVDS